MVKIKGPIKEIRAVDPKTGETLFTIKAKPRDFVNVVRCRDCIHYKPQKQSAHWQNETKYCCRVATMKMAPEDFCSKGERRPDHEPPKD